MGRIGIIANVGWLSNSTRNAIPNEILMGSSFLGFSWEAVAVKNDKGCKRVRRLKCTVGAAGNPVKIVSSKDTEIWNTLALF